MASKVNVRFVVILSVALLVAASGVAFFGYTVLANTGADHERRGDELMAEGNYSDAALAYGKAVFKDQGNVRWLEKWRDSLSKMTPGTDTAYNEAYRDYSASIQRLAIVQPSDASAQAAYIDMRYQEADRGGAGVASWERLAQDVTSALQLLTPGDPQVERIRRYRALANLKRLGSADLSQTELDEIRADLEAAMAADPQDIESALAIAELEAFEARRAFRIGQESNAVASWDESLRTLDGVSGRFPNSPRPELRKLEVLLDRAVARAATPAEETAARRALAEGLSGVLDRAEAAGPENLSPEFLQRLGARMSASDAGEAVRRRYLEIVRGAAEAQPDNAMTQLVLGQTLRRLDGSAEAYEVFDRVAGMPDLPVSLEGRLRREVRRRALSERATDALLMWESTRSDEWEQRLDASRRELAERLGADSPWTLRLEGQIAFIDGRVAEAVQKFTQLNSVTGSNDPQALALLAAALERDGSLGGALEQYDRILMLSPGNVEAELRAAAVEMRMDREPAARERYERVLRSDPTNETARERVALFQMMEADDGEGGSRTSAAQTLDSEQILDDATRALVEVERLLRQAEPDTARAITMLIDARELHPDDARIVKRLARAYVQAGDLDAALGIAREGAEAFPNDSELRAMSIALETGDPLETELRMIELSDATEQEKRLQRYGAHRRAVRLEEADEILNGLLADHPEDERVVEVAFVRALERGEFAEARGLASRAAAGNFDQVNGLLYQARIQLASGETAEALASLTRAKESLPYSAPIWRLLAQAQLATGRVDEALESYSRAMELKPDDVPTIRSYAQALLRIGRPETALSLLQENLDVVRKDPPLREAWLSLEEQHGRRDRALSIREQRLTAEPDNVENASALANLYIQSARWDDAQRVIEQMPQDGRSGLVRTALAAKWNAEQGRVDAGRQLFLQLLATLSEDSEKADAYIAMGDFLVEAGWDEQGIEAYEEAGSLEEGVRAEADRRLGDLYFMRGRYEDAIASYRSILSSGADPGARVGKRLAEALVRLERFDEAEAQLGEIEEAQGRSLETVMLLANIAQGRGDMRRARELVNEAVALAPTNAMPFMRRAQLFYDDPSQFNNVLEDLDQALRLQPDNVRALMMRVRLLVDAGRFNEAITSFEQAVQQRPTDDELRLNFVRQLLALQRFDDAKIAVSRAADVRGEAEPVWYVNAGDVYAGTGEHRMAARYYLQAYEAFEKPLGRLAPLVDVMLKAAPPQARDAQMVLAAHPSKGEENEELVLKLLRARVFDKLASVPEDDEGDPITPERLLGEAWELAEHDDRLVRVWFEQAVQVFEGDMDGLLAVVREEADPSSPLLRVLMAGPMSTDPSRWEAALAQLSGLEDQIEDQATLVSLFRARGQLFYGMGRYEEAAEQFRRSLEIDPESAEFNNNLAFTMAQHLDDPEGALEYAQKAEELAPNDPNVLDTIGVIYMNLDRLDEAERKLSRALSLALPQAPEQRFSARLHMAMLREKQGRTADASEMAIDARRIMETSPFLREAYGSEIDALMERLGLRQ